MFTRRSLVALAALLSLSDCESKADVHVTELDEDPKGGGVRFTRPDGTVVYVNPRAVAYVRAPLASEHGHAVIVFTSGHTQQVLETVDQVIHGIHIDMPKGGTQP